MDGGIGWGCGVLLEKLPEEERGPTTKKTRRVQTGRCLAIMEQAYQKREEGQFCQKRSCQGKGGPSKSPSHHGYLGGEYRKAEPVCHQRPARHQCPICELQLLKEKVPGVVQEVLQREPCWKTALSIPLSTALPGGAQEPGRMKGLNCLFWNSTWGHHQSWDQMLTTFSRSWPAAQGEIVKAIPPQNPQWRNMKDG